MWAGGKLSDVGYPYVVCREDLGAGGWAQWQLVKRRRMMPRMCGKWQAILMGRGSSRPGPGNMVVEIEAADIKRRSGSLCTAMQTRAPWWWWQEAPADTPGPKTPSLKIRALAGRQPEADCEEGGRNQKGSSRNGGFGSMACGGRLLSTYAKEALLRPARWMLGCWTARLLGCMAGLPPARSTARRGGRVNPRTRWSGLPPMAVAVAMAGGGCGCGGNVPSAQGARCEVRGADGGSTYCKCVRSAASADCKCQTARVRHCRAGRSTFGESGRR